MQADYPQPFWKHYVYFTSILISVMRQGIRQGKILNIFSCFASAQGQYSDAGVFLLAEKWGNFNIRFTCSSDRILSQHICKIWSVFVAMQNVQKTTNVAVPCWAIAWEIPRFVNQSARNLSALRGVKITIKSKKPGPTDHNSVFLWPTYVCLVLSWNKMRQFS